MVGVQGLFLCPSLPDVNDPGHRSFLGPDRVLRQSTEGTTPPEGLPGSVHTRHTHKIEDHRSSLDHSGRTVFTLQGKG